MKVIGDYKFGITSANSSTGAKGGNVYVLGSTGEVQKDVLGNPMAQDLEFIGWYPALPEGAQATIDKINEFAKVSFAIVDGSDISQLYISGVE